MILLDTDIVTLFAVGNDRIVEHVLSATEVVAITIVTRIEILRGRFDGVLKAADGEQLQLAQQRLLTAERDLARFLIVEVDSASARRFDDLRSQRRLKKIGRADLLIAGIALAHGATLVTRNLRHFRQVPGLKLENWAD